MTRLPHLDPDRYFPTGLDEDSEPLEEPDPPAPISLAATDILPEGEVALLLHLDDLHPESLPLCRVRVRMSADLICA